MTLIHCLRLHHLVIALAFGGILAAAGRPKAVTPGIRLPRLILPEPVVLASDASVKPVNDGGEYFIEVGTLVFLSSQPVILIQRKKHP